MREVPTPPCPHLGNLPLGPKVDTRASTPPPPPLGDIIGAGHCFAWILLQVAIDFGHKFQNHGKSGSDDGEEEENKGLNAFPVQLFCGSGALGMSREALTNYRQTFKEIVILGHIYRLHDPLSQSGMITRCAGKSQGGQFGHGGQPSRCYGKVCMQVGAENMGVTAGGQTKRKKKKKKERRKKKKREKSKMQISNNIKVRRYDIPASYSNDVNDLGKEKVISYSLRFFWSFL